MRGPGSVRFVSWTILWIALAESSALAQSLEQPIVVVVRSGESDASSREPLRLAAEARLRERGRAILDWPTSPPSIDIRPALADAIATYHDLRPADAIDEIDALLRIFERQGEGLGREEYISAYVHRALAALALGRTAEVDTSVDRVLAIDPAFEVDPARHPPSFARVIGAHRSNVRIAELRLVVDPRPSRVVIDGLERDVARDSFDLGVGPHVLRLEAPRCRSRVAQVVVAAAGGPHELHLDADPVERLRVPNEPGDAIDALVTSADSLGATLVVIDVVGRGDELAVTLVDRVENRVSRYVVDRDLSARAIIERGYDAPTADLVETQTPVDGPRRSRHRRRRLGLSIASGAAVVIGAAIGIGIGVANRGEFDGSFQRVAR